MRVLKSKFKKIFKSTGKFRIFIGTGIELTGETQDIEYKVASSGDFLELRFKGVILYFFKSEQYTIKKVEEGFYRIDSKYGNYGFIHCNKY